MKILITLNTDSAAFENVAEEVRRIFINLAAHVEFFGVEEKSICDSNGNIVGKMEVKE